MSDIIATDLQQLEPGSALVNLFELTLSNGTVIYLHSGTESDLTTVQFRDSKAPYTLRTYTAFPILIEGLELQSDGASHRPTFTLANIVSVFTGISGDFKNDDLVGRTLVRRRTLQKHLHGEYAAGSSGTAPTEFSVIKYVIDRIASQNASSVTFEVTAPYDLQNITLPRREVVGKYCSWVYQGAEDLRGGCSFRSGSEVIVDLNLNSGTTTSHRAFFDVNDVPLVAKSWAVQSSNAPAWAAGQRYGFRGVIEIGTPNVNSDVPHYVVNGGKYWQVQATHTATAPKEPSTTSDKQLWKEVRLYEDHDATDKDYSLGDLVIHSNAIYECYLGHNSSTSVAGTVLPTNKTFWVRIDLCGKTLNSCQCRFGFTPTSSLTNNNPPTFMKRNFVLPFGGFPGTQKF